MELSEEERNKLRDEVDGQIRQFGGRFQNYLVIVTKPNSPLLYWKSNDGTWAVGAASRYLTAMVDRIDDRKQAEEDR